MDIFDNPFDDLRTVQRQINRIFDTAFVRPFASPDWLWSDTSVERPLLTGRGGETTRDVAGETTGRGGEMITRAGEGEGTLGRPLGFGLWRPRFNVSENDKELTITGEIPGVDKNNIVLEVSPDGRLLTVKGEKKDEKKQEGEFFHRIERRFGTFQRSFSLPEGVSGDNVQAKFENGLLEVRVPKPESAGKMKHRQINIQ